MNQRPCEQQRQQQQFSRGDAEARGLLQRTFLLCNSHNHFSVREYQPRTRPQIKDDAIAGLRAPAALREHCYSCR